ncbi:MAG: VanZ family protein, partial [Bacteroidales bacterium]|nr:VanZ family protein [Bacteroidales bacterium]
GDYFFHILMFLPWAFFSGVFKMKKIYWVLIGLLFAAGSEGLQYLLPWRAFNVNDLLANMLGILLGSSLLFLFKIRQKS